MSHFVVPKRPLTNGELTAREGQDLLAKRTQEDDSTSSDYAMYQANATISTNLKTQFKDSFVEPGRPPQQQSNEQTANEAGMSNESSLEEHPALADSVQHDGIAPDNAHENADMLSNADVEDIIDELPDNQVDPALRYQKENKLANEKKLQQRKEMSSAPTMKPY